MSYMRMAKLLVPAGASCQASCGETFRPGQGQIAGLRGLQARCLSSAPKRAGMIWPSRIEVEVSVIQEAAWVTDVARATSAVTQAARKIAFIAASSVARRRRRRLHERIHILRRLGDDARLVEEAQVLHPVHHAVRPGAIGDEAA